MLATPCKAHINLLIGSEAGDPLRGLHPIDGYERGASEQNGVHIARSEQRRRSPTTCFRPRPNAGFRGAPVLQNGIQITAGRLG
jgi:hypothetical protein